ncbi:malate dehydrogenase [Carex littledalei]|uniref:Malate dehydrogenase n=1 Tax=Carex littledalei TaxID=544730 RepID=A0A833QC36_9POAL|nr:malate dehydrogenase [Carex littledalei]
MTNVDELEELRFIRDLHHRTIEELGLDKAIISGLLDELAQLLKGVAMMKELTPRATDFLAKAGIGSATLSMAYAAAQFADACLRGLRGDAGIVECSYVASQVTELPFFASKVRLSRGGVEEIMPPGSIK